MNLMRILKGRKEFLKLLKWSIRELLKLSMLFRLIDKYINGNIEKKVIKKFDHKVACYYGCLLIRPHKILKFDRQEDPQTLDVIMKSLEQNQLTGLLRQNAAVQDSLCQLTHVVERLSAAIIDDAVSRGAEAIIVACPLCQSNLDMRRPGINKYIKA